MTRVQYLLSARTQCRRHTSLAIFASASRLLLCPANRRAWELCMFLRKFHFPKILVEIGILMLKFFLRQTVPLKCFQERQYNPLKIWKCSRIDHVLANRTGRPRVLAGNDACRGTQQTFVFTVNERRRLGLKLSGRRVLQLTIPARAPRVACYADPLSLRSVQTRSTEIELIS